MALNVFELFGKIAIDGSGAMSGIDDTVGHAKKAESSLTQTFKKIGTAVAAAFSVRAVVDFGKQCTQAYASIAAEESAFAQIMGDYAETAQEKLDAVADQTGVTSTRMTGAMTSLTAKFKGLGYDVEDATTLASDGLLIAADAAAFWDMSLEESMSHLNSFINGSYEGGEAIGLFANDTQMAAYAIEQGIVADAKAWAALDEAQRQATRLDYAKNMMKSSGATGQAAKESEAYANVMANLKESWRQFQGVIGKPILEKIVLPAMQKLNNFLPKLTESVSNGIVWLEEGFDKIKSYFDEVFTEDGINIYALPDALTNMFRDMGRSVGRWLSDFGRSLHNGWNNTVWPMIQRTFKATFGIDLPSWEQLKSDISDGWNNTVWPAVQGFFTKAFGITLPSWENLKTNIKTGWEETVWPAIKNFFTTPFSITLPSWEELQTSIVNGWNNTVVPALSGLFEAVFEVKPEDTDGTEIGKKIREWWDLAVASIGDIFKAIFSVNTEDSDGATTGERIKTWFGSVLAYVGDVFKAIFGVETEDSDGAKTGEKIKTWFTSVLTYVGNIFKGFFSVELEKIEDVKTKITDWWDGVVKMISDKIGKIGASLKLPTIAEAKTMITNWWNEVVKDLGLTFLAIPDSAESDYSKKPAGSATIDLPGNGGSDGDDTEMKGPYDPMLNYIQNRYRVIDGLGGSAGGGGGAPTLAAQIQALTSSVQALTAGIPEAISAGISEITVTGSIDTGNIMLNTGALVGQITPLVNLRLGNALRRGSR